MKLGTIAVHIYSTDQCLLNVGLFYSKCGKKFWDSSWYPLDRGFTVQSKPTMGLKQSTINYNLHKKVEEGVWENVDLHPRVMYSDEMLQLDQA